MPRTYRYLPAVILVSTGLLTAFPGTAHAGKGTAFLGGLIGGSVLTNMVNRSERRTEAAEYRAYSRPAPAPTVVRAPAPAPASSQGSSVQDRLDTLDKLAANGMITKEEYQTRRQAIIDSL